MTTFKRSHLACGWSGTYTSAARGDYAKRQHSCEKNLAKAAAAERRLQREASVDRTPQPCLHKIAEHVHGTHACYVLDACRCTPCAKANTVYEAQRAKRHAYGRFDTFTDAEPIREHVRTLTDAGIGLKTIAKQSDVSHGALWKLVYGKTKADGTRTPSRRVTQPTAERLLALDPADPTLLADGAKVDATITRRKLQALVALGWSMSSLATRLGVLPTNFTLTMHHNSEVLVSTSRAVDELFAELSMLVPPHTEWRDHIAHSRARRYAAERRWFPPLAWDDIDDPHCLPDLDGALDELESETETETFDEAAVERAVNGDRTVTLTDDDLLEVVSRLHAHGLTDVQIGVRIGRKAHQVRHVRTKFLELPANKNPDVHDWDGYGQLADRRPSRRERKAS